MGPGVNARPIPERTPSSARPIAFAGRSNPPIETGGFLIRQSTRRGEACLARMAKGHHPTTWPERFGGFRGGDWLRARQGSTLPASRREKAAERGETVREAGFDRAGGEVEHAADLVEREAVQVVEG